MQQQDIPVDAPIMELESSVWEFMEKTGMTLGLLTMVNVVVGHLILLVGRPYFGAYAVSSSNGRSQWFFELTIIASLSASPSHRPQELVGNTPAHRAVFRYQLGSERPFYLPVDWKQPMASDCRLYWGSRLVNFAVSAGIVHHTAVLPEAKRLELPVSGPGSPVRNARTCSVSVQILYLVLLVNMHLLEKRQLPHTARFNSAGVSTRDVFSYSLQHRNHVGTREKNSLSYYGDSVLGVSHLNTSCNNELCRSDGYSKNGVESLPEMVSTRQVHTEDADKRSS